MRVESECITELYLESHSATSQVCPCVEPYPPGDWVLLRPATWQKKKTPGGWGWGGGETAMLTILTTVLDIFKRKNLVSCLKKIYIQYIETGPMLCCGSYNSGHEPFNSLLPILKSSYTFTPLLRREHLDGCKAYPSTLSKAHSLVKSSASCHQFQPVELFLSMPFRSSP